MTISTACLNESTSNSPSGVLNFIKFSDARLQAESSKNMYSEQGLEALIRSVLEHGFHSLTVVSNCIPGSPQMYAASAIWCMKSSVTRTLWFAFWKKTEP